MNGLHFKRQGSGCIVCDTRQGSDRTKFVGLIRRKRFSPGYTLCPLVKRGLKFSMTTPKQFKSLHTAEQWLLRHTLAWNKKRTYTPLNFILNHVLFDGPMVSPFVAQRLQLACTQIILAIVLAFFLPTESVVASVTLKAVAGVLCFTALANMIIFVRKHLL